MSSPLRIVFPHSYILLFPRTVSESNREHVVRSDATVEIILCLSSAVAGKWIISQGRETGNRVGSSPTLSSCEQPANLFFLFFFFVMVRGFLIEECRSHFYLDLRVVLECSYDGLCWLWFLLRGPWLYLSWVGGYVSITGNDDWMGWMGLKSNSRAVGYC